MQSKLLQVIVHQAITENLADAFFAIGATGIEEHFDSFIVYFNEEVTTLSKQLLQLQQQFEVSYTIQALEEKNWNKEWETNYTPIEIGSYCYIYAPFHQPNPNFKHQIVLNPRMAFGTGHHETTKMMVQALQKISVSNQSVLDLGCGTGILAILAKKENANYVLAVDFDEIAYENLEENFRRNQTTDIDKCCGTIDSVNKPFDIVLANINKNVLLNDKDAISNAVKPNGQLVVSGFYQSDQEEIIQSYNEFEVLEILSENDWKCIIFKKI